MAENNLPVPDPATAADHPEFNAFVETIAALRSPQGGCPWDMKQTHASIAKNMIEESYETVAAIEEGDADHMREELGDVLLQVVLQAQIAADAGEFTIDDVAHDVNEKIVRRHPHVFGAQAAMAAAGLTEAEVENARTADEVLDLWKVVKSHERKQKDAARTEKLRAAGLDPDAPRGLLEDVPRGEPALMRAQDISRKAVDVGFEWESTEDVWNQVKSEVDEFKAAPERSAEAEMEFGDVLFALVNVARREHIDAETALRRSCDKFSRRWEQMEAAAHAAGCRIEDYSTEQLNELWNAAKREVG